MSGESAESSKEAGWRRSGVRGGGPPSQGSGRHDMGEGSPRGGRGSSRTLQPQEGHGKVMTPGGSRASPGQRSLGQGAFGQSSGGRRSRLQAPEREKGYLEHKS